MTEQQQRKVHSVTVVQTRRESWESMIPESTKVESESSLRDFWEFELSLPQRRREASGSEQRQRVIEGRAVAKRNETRIRRCRT